MAKSDLKQPICGLQIQLVQRDQIGSLCLARHDPADDVAKPAAGQAALSRKALGTLHEWSPQRVITDPQQHGMRLVDFRISQPFPWTYLRSAPVGRSWPGLAHRRAAWRGTPKGGSGFGASHAISV